MTVHALLTLSHIDKRIAALRRRAQNGSSDLTVREQQEAVRLHFDRQALQRGDPRGVAAVLERRAA